MKPAKLLSTFLLLGALNPLHAHYTYLDCEPPQERACCPAQNQFFVTAEYLYWRPTQEGMTYALSIEDIDSGPLSANNKEIQQKSEWGSGYRAGIGANIADTPCDVYLTWTSFCHTAHSSNNDPFLIATQLLGPANPFVIGGSASGTGDAQSKWKLGMHIVEFDIGYRFFDNGCYFLRPYVGIVGGRLNQKQTITYNSFLDTSNSTLLDATIEQKNNFHGGGPKLGVQGHAAIGNGVGITGNLGAAFFYGMAKNPVSAEVLNDPVGFPLSDYVVKYEKHRVIPAFQGQIGLTWTAVSQSNLSIELAAFYEVQYFVGTWRNQNSQIQNLYIADAGFEDLMLNGFTGSLRVRF